MKTPFFPLAAFAVLTMLAAPSWAQAGSPASQAPPKVEGAWIRTAVAGQQGTGGFMRLTAPQSMQLVGASSPVAVATEVHEMKMDGDIMRMRAVQKLDLPAGKTIELKPGGYHLMLLDLKQPLPAGTDVPLTLVLRDANGRESKLELKVPVAARAPNATGGSHMNGHKH
jgi:copper(I)-binding protein